MSVIALRYANALATVTASAGLQVEIVKQQLDDFAATLAGSRELREVLASPAVPHDQKLKVLDAIAGRIGAGSQVRNFVAVVLDHGRLHEFAEIVDEYATVADQRAGIFEAEIVTAHELGEQDRAELEAQVVKLAGGQVRATYRQDASLLGGAVVRVGSTVYDGSIRTQLAQLKEKLVTA
ncbi:MAG: ATP synthase F1 subunit delta [Acidobacteriota bacterium]|nr:ATP synthase F1 subunit delta [Acidobacteriota bacterium]